MGTVTMGPAIVSVGPGAVSVTLSVTLSRTVAVTALVITVVTLVVTGAATGVEPHPANRPTAKIPTKAECIFMLTPLSGLQQYAPYTRCGGRVREADHMIGFSIPRPGGAAVTDHTDAQDLPGPTRRAAKNAVAAPLDRRYADV